MHKCDDKNSKMMFVEIICLRIVAQNFIFAKVAKIQSIYIQSCCMATKIMCGAALQII